MGNLVNIRCSVHHLCNRKRNAEGLYGFLAMSALSRLHPLTHEITVPSHAASVQTVTFINHINTGWEDAPTWAAFPRPTACHGIACMGTCLGARDDALLQSSTGPTVVGQTAADGIHGLVQYFQLLPKTLQPSRC